MHDTLETLTQRIQSQRYRRLILMVDIGSLVHFGRTISKLFQIDVLLMPNITLTSLLELGLDLSYEPASYRSWRNYCRVKISPVSSVLRSRKTAVRCW
ncbi:transcriptional regulatory protein zraR [Klebsiella michiganensis]|nr:transcriptional regulatory protein zraR [Klebsiella michiganensis]